MSDDTVYTGSAAPAAPQPAQQQSGQSADPHGAAVSAGPVGFAEQLRVLDFQIGCHVREMAFAGQQLRGARSDQARREFTSTAAICRRHLAALRAARETVQSFADLASRVAADLAGVQPMLRSAAVTAGPLVPASPGGGNSGASALGATHPGGGR